MRTRTIARGAGSTGGRCGDAGGPRAAEQDQPPPRSPRPAASGRQEPAGGAAPENAPIITSRAAAAARRQHQAGGGRARRVHHPEGRHPLDSRRSSSTTRGTGQDLELEPGHRERTGSIRATSFASCRRRRAQAPRKSRQRKEAGIDATALNAPDEPLGASPIRRLTPATPTSTSSVATAGRAGSAQHVSVSGKLPSRSGVSRPEQRLGFAEEMRAAERWRRPSRRRRCSPPMTPRTLVQPKCRRSPATRC